MAVTVLTTRGHIFGHPCHWDDESGVMRYDDTNEVVSVWGGEARPCPQCHQMPTPEGHDPCLGHIAGVHAACCGHGVDSGYILWGPLPDDSPLRRHRKDRGLTLREVAKPIGISFAYLSDLERGKKSDPSLAVARKLAAFFGVSVDDLFPHTDEATQ